MLVIYNPVLDRCYTTGMFESLQLWLSVNFFPVIFVVTAAIVADRFGGALLAGVVRRAVRYSSKSSGASDVDLKKRQATIVGVCRTIFRIIVWLTAVYSILGRFGIDPTPILAGASIIGLALSFGAQSLVKDFVSGVFIILENQYRVGDIVVLDGANGVVERISVRTTVIRDEDGGVHYIPNGIINHAVNKTMGYAKINMTLSVKPKTDVDKLAEVINDVGNKMFEEEKWSKKLLQAPKFVNISNFTASALDVKIGGKTKASALAGVTGELRKQLMNALSKHDIELAGAAAANPPAAKKK